jgi:hypothetical protein
MPTVIVNLTQQNVIQEMERVLETYPDHPYQQAFAHPELHQRLLAWVLSRVPNLFMVAEETDAIAIHPTYTPYCTDVRSCLEFVIRQGIQDILMQEQQTIEHCVPEEDDPNLPVSHWFG